MSHETKFPAVTVSAAESRRLLRVALDRAKADTQSAFPIISTNNVSAVLDYQEERIEFYRRELGICL
jgi:hypothetical protein